MAIDTPSKLEIEVVKLILSMRPGDMISLNPLGWLNHDLDPYKRLIMIKIDHERYYYIKSAKVLSLSMTKMCHFAIQGKGKLIRGGDHEQR
tara:strand:- start:258 stop:530 length:273 start_codon:yes stop_codon:yes gene_type:complete